MSTPVNPFQALSGEKKIKKEKKIVDNNPLKDLITENRNDASDSSVLQNIPAMENLNGSGVWADEEELPSNENDEDSFYTEIDPVSEAFKNAVKKQLSKGMIPNAGVNAKLEESEEEFDSSDDEEEEPINNTASISTDNNIKQINNNKSKNKKSKKGKKKKPVEDLDALLKEMAVNETNLNDVDDEAQNKNTELVKEEMTGADSAAAAFLASTGLDTGSVNNKSKKKKKNKNKKNSTNNVSSNTNSSQKEDNVTTNGVVDIKKVMAARTKPKKKSTSSAVSAAEAEAKARAAKVLAATKKKKDKSGYNHVPLK